MPGVFRIEGLSALGLKSACLFCGMLALWLVSVATARAEKKAATGSPALAVPVAGAANAPLPARFL